MYVCLELLSIRAVLSSDVVSLGSLQAISGRQEYALPAAVDLTRFGSVVIWCADFDVGFAGALLDAL